jgi:hypothetical protein
MIGAVELALKITRSDHPRFSHALLTGLFICLAILSISERQLGLVEKKLAGNSSAADPPVHFRAPSPASDARAVLCRTALLGLKNRATFVAYLGYPEAPIAFSELGMRGWVVAAPPTDPVERILETKRLHMPASVLNEQEWRRLSANWFSDLMNRGMDALLIESGGTLDTPQILSWARTAGLRDATEHPPGYILLLRN